ncbi:MAG: hypothetical protein IAF58_06990 [Leptolyngbya sp.]|nr:hypothetical protein [Candidatus Melainabacteria bacterium]
MDIRTRRILLGKTLLLWLSGNVVLCSGVVFAQNVSSDKDVTFAQRRVPVEVIGDSVKEQDHKYKMCAYRKLITGAMPLRDKEEISLRDNQIVVKEGPKDGDIKVLPDNISPSQMKNRAELFERNANYTTADIYYRLAIKLEIDQPNLDPEFRWQLLDQYLQFEKTKTGKSRTRHNFDKILKKDDSNVKR